MSVDVGYVMRQRAEGEGVLVEVLRVVNHRLHEGAGADIMSEIAEDLVAERVVPDILNDATAVSVRVGLQQVLRRGVGETREQQRLDLLVPHQIDDLFVSQDRIGWADRRTHQHEASSKLVNAIDNRSGNSYSHRTCERYQIRPSSSRIRRIRRMTPRPLDG